MSGLVLAAMEGLKMKETLVLLVLLLTDPRPPLSISNCLLRFLPCGLVIWSGFTWVVLLILAGLTYAPVVICCLGCGGGWARMASARIAYLCFLPLLVFQQSFQQSGPSLFTCQAAGFQESAGEACTVSWGLDLELEQPNFYCFRCTKASQWVYPHILLSFTEAVWRGLLSVWSAEPHLLHAFPCCICTPQPTPLGRPALLTFSFSLILSTFQIPPS